MAAQKVAGTAYFKIDGVPLTMRGSGKIKPSTVKREAITNIDTTISFKEMPVAGEMSLELEAGPGFSAQALNGISNATVTFEAANGTVYILNGGFQIDELEIDTDEGKVTAKFAGTVIEA